MAKDIYRDITQVQDRLRVKALAYVDNEVQKYSGSFEAAFTFDVDSFCYNLALITDNPLVAPLDVGLRAEHGGAIVAVLGKQTKVADPIIYKPSLVYSHDRYKIEEMYDFVRQLVLHNRPLRSFPVVTYKLTYEHRPRTREATNVVMAAIVRTACIINPDYAMRAYCAHASIIYYTTLPLDTNPVAQYIKPNQIDHYRANRPVFVGYTTYDELAALEYPAMGFVFNPYRKTSQALMQQIQRNRDHYEITYILAYRTYKVHYPLDLSKYSMYTYCTDVWPFVLGIDRIVDVHPKWYVFDLVSTQAMHIPHRDIIMMDVEFISPRIYTSVNTYEYESVMQIRPSIGQDIAIYSRAHTRVFHCRPVYCVFHKLIIADRTNGWIEFVGESQRHVCYNYLVQGDEYIYYQESYYKLDMSDKVPRVDENLYYQIDVAIFRERTTMHVAYIREIRIADVITASRYYGLDTTISIVRDYIIDVGKHEEFDIEFDDTDSTLLHTDMVPPEVIVWDEPIRTVNKA